MHTIKELLYMVMDELREVSDDTSFTQDHIVFLLTKYRAFLLKQKYSDIKKVIPIDNYQNIVIPVDNSNKIPSIGEATTYLKSTIAVPSIINIGNPRVYPLDYFVDDIALVSKDRLRYVGLNKYMTNVIYCAINADKHIYFKSSNPEHKSMRSVMFNAIFSNAIDAIPLTEDPKNDIYDNVFPIEDSLVSPMIELIVKELIRPVNSPVDTINNANKDIPE